MVQAMPTHQRGFTLLELLTVVTIIGILSAIGLPAYQDHMVRSQASAALKELSALKNQAEVIINQGKSTWSLDRLDGTFLGMTESGGKYCDLSLSSTTLDQSGANTMTCTAKNGYAAKFNGKFIKWTRQTSGIWFCTTNLEDKYKPGTCSAP